MQSNTRYIILLTITTLLFCGLWIRVQFILPETRVVRREIEIPARQTLLMRIPPSRVEIILPDTLSQHRHAQAQILLATIDSLRAELQKMQVESIVHFDTTTSLGDTIAIQYDEVTRSLKSLLLRPAPQKLIIDDYVTYVPPTDDKKFLGMNMDDFEEYAKAVLFFGAGVAVRSLLQGDSNAGK